VPIPKGKGRRATLRAARPSVLAPGSALGLLPSRALSSTQVIKHYTASRMPVQGMRTGLFQPPVLRPDFQRSNRQAGRLRGLALFPAEPSAYQKLEPSVIQ